ncbi:MAG: DUF2029 domain-containing protein [Jatrophihabitans sp.]|nr:MAG: DUF2029 domain-containing protein [Jatrophihabitans sp.]
MSGRALVAGPRPSQRVRLSDLRIRHVWPLWLALAALMYTGLDVYARRGVFGIDAHAYWLTGHHVHLYGATATTRDAYLYSPAFAQAIRPLTWLPWPAFYGLWVVLEAAAFAWLLKPLGWAWGVPALLLCGFEIYQGNVVALLAVALVVGLGRGPRAWAFPALTKVTVALGPLWFVVRGEWRALRTVAVTVAVVLAISVALDPSAWASWLHLLVRHPGLDPTLPYRLATAVAVTVYAARADRTWLLAPAMILASPVTHGLGQYLTLLAAIPRLRRPHTVHARRDPATAVR